MCRRCIEHLIGVRTVGQKDFYMESKISTCQEFLAEFGDAYERIKGACPMETCCKGHHCESPELRAPKLCACVITRRRGNVGITPAMLALRHNDEAAAKDLIVTGREPVRTIESCGSLLNYACLMGYRDTVDWLLNP